MEHWFVYYKLPRQEALALLPRVRAMIAEVSTATGVRARLLRKLDGDAGPTTLMETYERIEDAAAFETALGEALVRAELPARAVQARRTERFGDL
jgi:hypothetical protein